MADKNITLRQKNTSGVYDKLYTKTTATQSKLSTATAALFGDGTSDADAALAKIADTVKSIGDVQVKVVDPNGNPIQGARITGLYGTPTTASDGTAHGVLQTNPISISSPYIDLKDQTADASGYIGSFNALVVTLPIVGENNIIRITSSKTVKFSKAVKTVDVCCVGGGGGGSGGYGHTAGSFGGSSWSASAWKGKGGAGGNIVTSTGVEVVSDTAYTLTIGSGGAGSDPLVYSISNVQDTDKQLANTAGTGGTTSFRGVSATGGTGGSTTVGTSTNGGNGGSANATGTEFNDGSTYYSGGGANGGDPVISGGTIISGPVGGTPYGGYGGYTDTSGGSYNYVGVAGGNGRGYGGGGGGGNSYIRYYSGGNELKAMTKGGNGASGAVAIRFHF